MSLKHVLLMLAAFLAGCASAPPHAASASPAAQMATLEPLGELFTTTVNVAGAPRRFLVDTGGGITVFAPELAAVSGCRLGGPITGFRMSGERMDAPRCEGATVGIAGWASRPHTVMVLDINHLLPPDWPRVDGLLSLASFQGHTVTVDLGGKRLVVDGPLPPGSRSVRARFERSMAGLSLVAFMASQHPTADVWLEVDTGSTSALIIRDAMAPLLGLSAPVASPGTTANLHIDSGPPVQTPVEVESMIFDGNVGLGTLRTWALTFDLANERMWVRRP